MSKLYKIENGKLERTHRSCPKCGQGYFLGDHYDRWACGKCGYTTFKRKGKKPIAGKQPARGGGGPRRRPSTRVREKTK